MIKKNENALYKKKVKLKDLLKWEQNEKNTLIVIVEREVFFFDKIKATTNKKG